LIEKIYHGVARRSTEFWFFNICEISVKIRGEIIKSEEQLVKITKNEVLHVADLARLDLDEESIDRFAGQIGEILEYVDTLNKLDTKGIIPTSHAIFLNNAFREDEEKQHLDTDAALANAPEKEDGGFIVPKVVG